MGRHNLSRLLDHLDLLAKLLPKLRSKQLLSRLLDQLDLLAKLLAKLLPKASGFEPKGGTHGLEAHPPIGHAATYHLHCKNLCRNVCFV